MVNVSVAGGRSRHLFALLWILAALLTLLPGCGLPQQGLNEARLARMTRGINLSHWFAQGASNSSHYQNFYTSSDFEQIKALGFRHVRLPIDPYVLFSAGTPETLNERNLGYLDAALDAIYAADLAAIVEIHPDEKFNERLKTNDQLVDGFVRFWGVFARHLSRRDPEKLFLEAMNEAHFENPTRWEAVQRRLLAAMREGAPQHTLIAAGDSWSSIDMLVELTPLEDRNIVYNFHFYEPHNFTHQGATWGWDMWRHFRNMPYPSSPEAVQAILPQISEPSALEHIRWYGQERWNAEKIAERIEIAARWAKQHNVHLTCNEFGVYRLVAPPDARNAWITDVRTALEQHNIGWAMWDYAGGFSVMRDEGVTRVPDQATLSALGLGE